MRQDVVRALRKMTERTRYFAGLRTWVGFTQIGIDLPRGKRLAGRPKQSFSRLFKQALDAVFAFSTVPLKFLTLLGVVAFFAALFIAAMVVILRLIHPEVSIEWAPTIIVIVFLGGIQLIGLGILGEYMGRIYDEVRARPVSIVKTLTNAKGTTSDGIPFSGYEMHMGVTTGGDCARPFAHLADGTPEGAVSGNGRVIGTYIHGLFADDRQRGAWLSRLGAGPATVAYDELVESTLDRLAKHLTTFVDLDRLLSLAR